MAEMGTLHEAFVDELRDTYDAEKQLTKALPKMAKAANSPELRGAIESHLEETRHQVERLEQVFESLDEKARGKHCDGIAGIIQEAQAMMQENFDEATADACLIAAAQRAEHYEMAAYGTLVSWARAMGHDDAADLLQETLDEETAADEFAVHLGRPMGVAWDVDAAILQHALFNNLAVVRQGAALDEMLGADEQRRGPEHARRAGDAEGLAVVIVHRAPGVERKAGGVGRELAAERTV